MACPINPRLLNAYLDGDVREKQRAALARHLEVCAACRAEYLELRQTVHLISAHGRQKCPLDYRETALAACRPLTGRRRPTALRLPSRRALSWALAGCLAVGLAFAVGRGLPPPPERRADTTLLARPDIGLLHEAYRAQQALGETDGIVFTVSRAETSPIAR